VRRTQFRDYPQDVGEQISWNGNLRHLEGKVAAMADDLRTYLDELFVEPRERPALDRLRRPQCAQQSAGLLHWDVT
jgi:hypothetical protein